MRFEGRQAAESASKAEKAVVAKILEQGEAVVLIGRKHVRRGCSPFRASRRAMRTKAATECPGGGSSMSTAVATPCMSRA